MHYVNCIERSLFLPKMDHCQRDLGLQKTSEKQAKLTRIALAVIPFIALYRPVGTAISLGTGTCRFIFHLRLVLIYQKKCEWRNVSKEFIQTILAVVCLSSSITKIGQLVTGSIDTMQGAYYTTYYVLQGNCHKATEQALQMMTTSLYLTFLLIGSFEVILLSVLFQVVLHLCQIKDNIFKEHYIEAIAKLGMVIIHLNQANIYKCLIQKRKAFLALQKYQNLIRQALQGRSFWHLIHHSLIDLNGKIDENKINLSHQEREYNFGSHFHGYGKGLVKGANLSFRTVMIDGKELTECEFKINHVFREKLQKRLNELKNLNISEICDILQFTHSHAESLHVEESKDNFDNVYRIIASGLGQITIGASRDLPNLFDRVVVLMDRKKTLFDLHELLSLTDLDTALIPSSKDDLNRLKMGHLFRTFFPEEATSFERSKDFFTVSTQELLDQMIEKSPLMKEIYNKYFDQMKEAEILPGRIRYKLHGLAKEIQELGGCHLTAAITGAHTNQSLYQKAASMLSLGMLSQEIKAKYLINTKEALGMDYYSGGADSVFTQMLTTKDKLLEGFDLSNLNYQSNLRILISLDALETGTYQYLRNNYGTRLMDYAESSIFKEIYINRPTLSEFTTTIQEISDANKYSEHEVMLKERVPPSYFEGFLVNNEETRVGLLDHLRTCNLIQKDALNREVIQGRLVEDFIRINER